MLQVAIGHSNDPDSCYAIAEVLEQCRSTLAGNQPQAGILFAAIDFDHSLILHKINLAFPGIILIGGTTDGEISSILEYQQDSLTLMLFCADKIEITAGIGRDVSKNTIAATKAASEQAKANITSIPKLCLTIPESLTTSGVAIVEGLKTALGNLPIFGGTSGDGFKLQRSYQFWNTEVTSDAVTILLFSGEVLFSHGIAHGWNPIGKPGIITKVDKNVLHEIDGKPAIDFYRRYLGDLPPSPEYPLAIFETGIRDFYLRGTTGTYIPNSGSITFVADIPIQARVQIAEATRNDVLNAAKTSMLQALAAFKGKEPAAALFFICSARRQILGTQTKEEYSRLKSYLPPSLSCCGFYTYGEIASLQANDETRFHNETFVTVLIGG